MISEDIERLADRILAYDEPDLTPLINILEKKRSRAVDLGKYAWEAQATLLETSVTGRLQDSRIDESPWFPFIHRQEELEGHPHLVGGQTQSLVVRETVPHASQEVK